MLTAGAIMTTELTTIRPEASVEEAIGLLISGNISGLPVTNSLGCLEGVITEFALLATVYDQQVNAQTVAQHMTREVITADVDDPISQLADLCIVHRVRRLPVTKNGQLVGLVARRDVLRALHLSHGLERFIGNLEPDPQAAKIESKEPSRYLLETEVQAT
ncbi:MAG: CBS domain-containing protein [Pirellulales bacterium]